MNKKSILLSGILILLITIVAGVYILKGNKTEPAYFDSNGNALSLYFSSAKAAIK